MSLRAAGTRMLQGTAAIVLGLLFMFATLSASAQDTAIQPIEYGDRVQGELTPSQAGKLYSFAAREGDIITITMNADSAGLDPFVILLDEGQRRVLALDDDSGGRPNARLRYVISSTARYLIKATTRHPEVGGRFTLTLSLTNPPQPPGLPAPRIMPLSPAETVRASLSDAEPFHLYALHAAAGETVSFALDMEGDAQAGLYLYTANFNEQVGSGELGQPLNAIAPADGLYFLVAARIGGSGAGTYRLRAVDAPRAALTGAPRPASVLLVPGQAQPGTIGPRMANVFSFEGRARSSIRLDAEPAPGLRVVIILTDANFRQISVGDGAIRAAALPDDGTYYVIVARQAGPNDVAQGDYALTLSSAVDPNIALTPLPTFIPPTQPGAVTPTPAGVQITSIAYGQTISGSIDAQKFAHYFSFQGVQGDVISVHMSRVSGGTLDPVLYLYMYAEVGQPTLVAGNDAIQPGSADAGIVRFALPATGPYLIVATRAGAAQGQTIGSFILRLEVHR